MAVACLLEPSSRPRCSTDFEVFCDFSPQMASPNFTPIYACLVAVVNTKMPEIGELVIKRVILQFRRAFKRNDKVTLMSLIYFYRCFSFIS